MNSGTGIFSRYLFSYVRNITSLNLLIYDRKDVQERQVYSATCDFTDSMTSASTKLALDDSLYQAISQVINRVR